MSPEILVVGGIGVILVLAWMFTGKAARSAGDAPTKSDDARAKGRENDEPRSPSSPAAAKPAAIPDWTPEHEDDDEDITLMTVRLAVEGDSVKPARRDGDSSGPDYDSVEIAEIDEDLEPAAQAHQLVADQGAEEDVPTLSKDAFLVFAARQSDQGHKRKRNEDHYLVRHQDGVYVVADGMGGYAGGDIASRTATATIDGCFEKKEFHAKVHAELPRRAKELAQSMQSANLAIWEQATDEKELRGMGTTLVAARFALRKKRLYIGHVGDSRCYRVRDGSLKQLTQDHTLESLMGLKGPGSGRLVRAVGIRSEVEIDVIIAEPRVGDIYLLCSDGLTKMIDDETIRGVLAEITDLDEATSRLIDLALEAGGKDNVTVILVRVDPANALQTKS